LNPGAFGVRQLAAALSIKQKQSATKYADKVYLICEICVNSWRCFSEQSGSGLPHPKQADEFRSELTNNRTVRLTSYSSFVTKPRGALSFARVSVEREALLRRSRGQRKDTILEQIKCPHVFPGWTEHHISGLCGGWR
jgi:hypothetical protein